MEVENDYEINDGGVDTRDESGNFPYEIPRERPSTSLESMGVSQVELHVG